MNASLPPSGELARADEEHPFEIASKRAAKYAPLPKYDPLHAGMVGGVVAALSALVFKTFAGMGPEDHDHATVATAVFGFGVVYLFFWNQKRIHDNARAKEYDLLVNPTDKA